MGNRAVITTKQGWEDKEHNLGIYLHWNGGRDSVEGFLAYCKLKQYRTPETDDYGWACLTTVISNFFGDGLSIGIDTVNRLDCNNGDNGVYIIENWEIVGREYHEGCEQSTHELEEMVLDLDRCMPKKSQLGEENIIKGLKDLGYVQGE